MAHTSFLGQFLNKANNAAGEAADAAQFVCTVDVDVKLKAFVPQLNPRSVAVLFRMADRAQTFAQYASYWQSRPPVPVGRSPSMWWKHAGSAAARECRLISRRQVKPIPTSCPAFLGAGLITCLCHHKQRSLCKGLHFLIRRITASDNACASASIFVCLLYTGHTCKLGALGKCDSFWGVHSSMQPQFCAI